MTLRKYKTGESEGKILEALDPLLFSRNTGINLENPGRPCHSQSERADATEAMSLPHPPLSLSLSLHLDRSVSW